MPYTHEGTVSATIQSRLDILDQIKGNWEDKGQKSFMQKWHREASDLIKCNLQLLCGLAGSADQVEIAVVYTFPKVELAIITDYLNNLAENAGPSQRYPLPSYLPCFGDSASLELNRNNSPPSERYQGRSPLLVNFELFRIQDALLRVQVSEPLSPSIYTSKWIEHFALDSDWDRLIYKPIVSAVRAEWHKLELCDQHQVLRDLEYFSMRILKTPLWRTEYKGRDIKSSKDLGRYIVRCWNPKVYPNMDMGFAPETRSFWHAAGFVLKASRRHSQAQANSTGTSHSLGRSANEFVPQARSLFSHGF